eukprot:TRINITY_DN47432_c0_g1_i1.p1 TRINITY_DN47432_c0_g1~~TRINITY_DN47432_c0_g1_i1.p1  ORF type:complete len:330 (+),score=47.68 TRINITY_DN47432_c0_g1_i1:60-992(+)
MPMAVAAASLVSLGCYAQCKDRPLHVFYLRPDADELQLLEAAAKGHCRTAGVELRWGEHLPSERGVDVLVTRIPTAEELDSLAPDLRSLLVPFAGPTETTKALMRERPHLSLHNSHFNAVPTAELAIALLMAVVKRVGELDLQMRGEAKSGMAWTAGFQNRTMDTMKLSGRTAVVLGYGAIGSRVATVLHAMGMDVHAVRRSAPAGNASDGVATVHQLADLHALLPKADVLVVCLPGTMHTVGLLGHEELQAMPKGAFLVNVGRANVIDEEALFRALQDGHLGGAGLDVWYNYPMLSGQGMDNNEHVLGP